MPWPLLIPLGLIGGVLTTLAGLGGGVLMLLVISLFIGPAAALALTAPALLFGNAHRWYLYRHQVDRAIAWRCAAGSLPGALIGGFLVVRVPGWLLQGLMLFMVALALLRAFGWLRLVLPPRLLLPSFLLIGAMTATSGGAGVLAAPLLLASGLQGEAYIATSALAATTMHAGRLVAYGAGGLLSGPLLLRALLLTAAVLVGNLLGQRLRAALPPPLSRRMEIGVMVLCVGLALWGMHAR